MIAVVRTPPEGEFGKVACAYYKPADLVGKIHEYLGALSGLDVFVCDIVHGRVMSDLFKMLKASLLYVDFAEFRSERFDQLHGVFMRDIGGAESGHGHCQDVSLRQFQQVECLCRDHQRQRGIKASRHTDHCPFYAGVFKPFCQSGGLYRKYFPAPFISSLFVRRDERMWIHMPRQPHFLVPAERERYLPEIPL